MRQSRSKRFIRTCGEFETPGRIETLLRPNHGPIDWTKPMNNIAVLDVLLYGERIGTLTRLPGDRVLFAFTEAYIADLDRATLSLSFKDTLGNLIKEVRPHPN